MPFVLANTAFNHSSRQQLQRQHQQYQQTQQHLADFAYELYITPHYARALVDVIEHYNWRDFWYLYKNDEGKVTMIRWRRIRELQTIAIDDAGVCQSLSVTLVCCAKTAERIDILFVMEIPGVQETVLKGVSGHVSPRRGGAGSMRPFPNYFGCLLGC